MTTPDDTAIPYRLTRMTHEQHNDAVDLISRLGHDLAEANRELAEARELAVGLANVTVHNLTVGATLTIHSLAKTHGMGALDDETWPLPDGWEHLIDEWEAEAIVAFQEARS